MGKKEIGARIWACIIYQENFNNLDEIIKKNNKKHNFLEDYNDKK